MCLTVFGTELARLSRAEGQEEANEILNVPPPLRSLSISPERGGQVQPHPHPHPLPKCQLQRHKMRPRSKSSPWLWEKAICSQISVIASGQAAQVRAAEVGSDNHQRRSSTCITENITIVQLDDKHYLSFEMNGRSQVLFVMEHEGLIAVG